MDVTTIIGLLLGFGAVLGSIVLEGGHLGAFLNLSAFIIVVGGTLGASTVSFSLDTMLKVPRFLKDAFSQVQIDSVERVRQITGLSLKARRDGLLSLEDDATAAGEPMMNKGLQLIVDGTEPELTKTVLETELVVWEQQERLGEQVFINLGGYAPTMGIIGTVMGLVHALGNVDDPKQMALAIGSAFMATLYGVAFANLVLLPIGGKLKSRMEERRTLHELTIDGLLAIQAGDNPRIVQEKLSTYLSRSDRTQLQRVAEGGAS